MIRAAVVGASGYAGAELVRILERASPCGPDRDYLQAICRSPLRHHLSGPQRIRPVDLRRQRSRCHLQKQRCGVSGPATQGLHGHGSGLFDAGKRVVDLSADFRFKNRDAYEAHYQPHSCAHLMERSVYGLCERYGDQVAAADLIGNPGCYPTSVLLPLLPLVGEGSWIRPPSLPIASPVSAAPAAAPPATTHFCHVNESFKAYKVGGHRHTPEMEENISLLRGRAGQRSPLFPT
jgi:N-acetyl-gamma-glutamyl-phosphate reductase